MCARSEVSRMAYGVWGVGAGDQARRAGHGMWKKGMGWCVGCGEQSVRFKEWCVRCGVERVKCKKKCMAFGVGVWGMWEKL